jgi:hypothetical protein
VTHNLRSRRTGERGKVICSALALVLLSLPCVVSAQGVQIGFKRPCLAADFDRAKDYLEIAAGSEANLAAQEGRDTPQFRALPEFTRFIDIDVQTIAGAEATASGVFVPPCLERARDELKQALALHLKALAIYRSTRKTTNAAYQRQRQAAFVHYKAYREGFRLAQTQVTAQ